jgi:hypothetical protein
MPFVLLAALAGAWARRLHGPKTRTKNEIKIQVFQDLILMLFIRASLRIVDIIKYGGSILNYFEFLLRDRHRLAECGARSRQKI